MLVLRRWFAVDWRNGFVPPSTASGTTGTCLTLRSARLDGKMTDEASDVGSA
jgi:hypothetical protein